jgi:hypothetical protein
MGGRTIGQEGVDGTGEAGSGGRAKWTVGVGMGRGGGWEEREVRRACGS